MFGGDSMSAPDPNLETSSSVVEGATAFADEGQARAGLFARWWKGTEDPKAFRFRWWHLAISVLGHFGLSYAASAFLLAALPKKDLVLLRIGMVLLFAAFAWLLVSFGWCVRRAWQSRPWFEFVLIVVGWFVLNMAPAGLAEDRWKRVVDALEESRSETPGSEQVPDVPG